MRSPGVILPPGQYVTRELPVQLMGSVPHFTPETWDFRVFGLAETPVTLLYPEYLLLPRTEQVSDLHDAMTWTVLDNLWEGIPTRELLARARPRPEARFALLHADGGVVTSLPLDDLLRADVLIAEKRNGLPLPPEQGFPARLIVPHRYGHKGLKWLRAIELTADSQRGFFELRGFSDTADPWTDDRFAAD